MRENFQHSCLGMVILINGGTKPTVNYLVINKLEYWIEEIVCATYVSKIFLNLLKSSRLKDSTRMPSVAREMKPV